MRYTGETKVVSRKSLRNLPRSTLPCGQCDRWDRADKDRFKAVTAYRLRNTIVPTFYMCSSILRDYDLELSPEEFTIMQVHDS